MQDIENNNWIILDPLGNMLIWLWWPIFKILTTLKQHKLNYV